MKNLRIPYATRNVRFHEIFRCPNWQVKIYIISSTASVVDAAIIYQAKYELPGWLKASNKSGLEVYGYATLILHQTKYGVFAVINWWLDENMLQHFVYLAPIKDPLSFNLYSYNGIITCVWELSVLWHERNAWVSHVLMNPGNPDYQAYLDDQLNSIV